MHMATAKAQLQSTKDPKVEQKAQSPKIIALQHSNNSERFDIMS